MYEVCMCVAVTGNAHMLIRSSSRDYYCTGLLSMFGALLGTRVLSAVDQPFAASAGLPIDHSTKRLDACFSFHNHPS
jgi:hypothetical protein